MPRSFAFPQRQGPRLTGTAHCELRGAVRAKLRPRDKGTEPAKGCDPPRRQLRGAAPSPGRAPRRGYPAAFPLGVWVSPAPPPLEFLPSSSSSSFSSIPSEAAGS